MNAESAAGVFQPMNNTDLQKRLCPLLAGTVSAITWEALARPPSQAYFFFAAFFLAFFFAFAMLALQVVGLVRGRSIYTRNKITSKRARNSHKCDRRSHREKVCEGTRRSTLRCVRMLSMLGSAHPLHHSSERMNFHSAGSTGVMERRLPLRSKTMFLSSFAAC